MSDDNDDLAPPHAIVRRHMQLGELPLVWPDEPSGEDQAKIFDRSDVEEKIDYIDAASANPDSGERIKKLVKTLFQRGEYRKLWALDYCERRQKIDDLRHDFPNFGEVLDDVEGAFALADLGKDYVRIQPMLLVGSPGVGKSFFASELAQLLCPAPPVTTQFATAQSSATLAGSEAFWSNSSPGLILKTLVYGQYASPFMILEELDKIGRNLTYDPTGSLYALFEPATARRFIDLSFEWLHLDASRIAFICTANGIGDISDAILSRMRVYEINDLSPLQSRDMLYKILDSIQLTLPQPLHSMQLDPDVVAYLVTQPPRAIRNALTRAIGRAVHRGCWTSVSMCDVSGIEKIRTRKIGFGY
jgi:ATP-dependent Lon protease